VNVYGDAWEGGNDRPGYTSRRMRIAGDMLGLSVYELPAGQKSFPYHQHHANEELLIVLEGEPTLRGPEGEQALVRGDAVVFRRGPEGAHQLRNDTGKPARLAIASTLMAPEVVEYLDSAKAGVSGPTLERGMFLRSTAVDYWEGEE
jgi:uncharacterized cupin superfamily protein